jgi:acyl carrier protein
MSEQIVLEHNLKSVAAAAVRTDVIDILTDVFQFEGDLRLDTSPEDIERWDSLQHVALIAALETKFGISLSMDEMMEIASVANIHTVLERHSV